MLANPLIGSVFHMAANLEFNDKPFLQGFGDPVGSCSGVGSIVDTFHHYIICELQHLANVLEHICMPWIHVELTRLICLPHIHVKCTSIDNASKIAFVKRRKCTDASLCVGGDLVRVHLYNCKHSLQVLDIPELKHLLFKQVKLAGCDDRPLPAFFIDLHNSSLLLWNDVRRSMVMEQRQDVN